MPPLEIIPPRGRRMPALILDERSIRPEVHAHGLAAHRAVRHEFARHLHARERTSRQRQLAVRPRYVALRFEHRADRGLVVVRLLVARLAALPEAVIALGVEEPLFVEARQLELMVNVGGEHEVVAAAHEVEQVGVYAGRREVVTVAIDVAAPIRPMLLEGVEGVEPTGIHVGEAVLLDEIAEPPVESLACIRKASRG